MTRISRLPDGTDAGDGDRLERPDQLVGVADEVADERLGLGDQVDLGQAQADQPGLPVGQDPRELLLDRRHALDKVDDRAGQRAGDEDDEHDEAGGQGRVYEDDGGHPRQERDRPCQSSTRPG